MATIRISEFRGLIPKSDPRKLPAGFADTAIDTRFDAGDLSPIRKRAFLGVLDGDIGDIYHLSRLYGGRTNPFLAFGSAMETYFLPGPVPDDQHDRFYWCIHRPGVTHSSLLRQDGIRMLPNAFVDQNQFNASAPVGSGSTFRQHIGDPVGIPSPSEAPDVEDVTQPAVATRVADISRTSTVTVSLEQEVPFAEGELVRIVIDPSLPKSPEQEETGELPEEDTEEPADPNIGRLWLLSGKEGRVSAVNASGDRTFNIVGVSGLALGSDDLTLEEKDAISIERVINDSELESRVYVYTFVSHYDEEGPPSPPSKVIDALARGGMVKLTISPSADGGGTTANRKYARVYRKVAGSSSGAYLFVDDVPMSNISQPLEFVDESATVELGEPLPSERWYPPPEGLQGAHVHPNGFFVAWKGNTLYFSEPYLPHAWNPDYKRTVDAEIVSVQSYGNTLVIGTTGRPYIASGVDPASISIRKLDTFAPVMHPRAMVDAGQGVVYPSSVGLMMVTAAGAKNLTEGLFDKKTWDEELATFRRGIYHDERVIFFDRTQQPWVLDFNGGKAELSRLSDIHDYSAACVRDRDLVFVTKYGSQYRRPVVFKSDAETEQMRWRSGLLTLDRACNLAAGQVFASDYSDLTITLYWANLSEETRQANPVAKHMEFWSHVVEGPEPFRLPSTYMSREFIVEIVSAGRVQEVIFSTSMEEIRRA